MQTLAIANETVKLNLKYRIVTIEWQIQHGFSFQFFIIIVHIIEFLLSKVLAR